jgi:predicted amidophosphoribosyltransferase
MTIASTLGLPLFSVRCACCRQPGSELCRPCRFALATSRAVQVADPDGGPPIAAALEFDGAARRAVLALKFANRRGVARYLAELVVRRLDLVGDRPGRPAFDVVTWAPTGAGRARRRGYDQAQLLARHIARQLGVPCTRLLWREHGGPQVGLGRAERLRGPSFRGRPTSRPLRVLLVDDVVTTGSTLHAAAAALRRAGVLELRAVAVAATPDRLTVRAGVRHGAATAAERPPGRLDAA